MKKRQGDGIYQLVSSDWGLTETSLHQDDIMFTEKRCFLMSCVTRHFHRSFHKVPLPEQQDVMEAETALMTSTEALKNDSLAPRSFSLMVFFHGALPPNLRNENIVRRSSSHSQKLTYNFLASQSFGISSTRICAIHQACPAYHT